MCDRPDRTRFARVEHILGSGAGQLDFAVEGEDSYYTWNEAEDAEWTVEEVAEVENADEDRFVMYPEGDYFACEIAACDGERDVEVVRCWSV